MNKKYTVGVDFGTLSGRAAVVDLTTGMSIAERVMEYPHAVLETALPDGTPLPRDFALAVPADYLAVLMETIRGAVFASGVPKEDIIGIGLDVTSSTFLPVDLNGGPLCEKPEYASRPHAWMKLWKHHGGSALAERMTELARIANEPFLDRCGGMINAEWMLPKLAEILQDDPEITEVADCFMEAGDWLVRKLTGSHTRSACAAGYKMLADETLSDAYLDSVVPGFSELLKTKTGGRRVQLGERAGMLTEEAADLLGLMPGIAVAAANVDAHVASPALSIDGPGKLLMILGTSCCAMLSAETEQKVPGIFGMVRNGILPGYVGYEAGQSCVGDLYNWYVRSGGYSHADLTEKASKLRPGESGLLALDWFNGNRSVLSDADLSGMILGLTLRTRPEEIYRALIEATAFGMRVIIENFESHGIPVRELYACGGIVKKNPLLMQIYADITGREIQIASAEQPTAIGSAMHAAVAAGYFPDILEAARVIGRTEEKTYRPIEAHRDTYDALYREYVRLHDYFGRGGNDVMKTLKRCANKR